MCVWEVAEWRQPSEQSVGEQLNGLTVNFLVFYDLHQYAEEWDLTLKNFSEQGKITHNVYIIM